MHGSHDMSLSRLRSRIQISKVTSNPYRNKHDKQCLLTNNSIVHYGSLHFVSDETATNKDNASAHSDRPKGSTKLR